jgi:hypothetical protein
MRKLVVLVTNILPVETKNSSTSKSLTRMRLAYNMLIRQGHLVTMCPMISQSVGLRLKILKWELRITPP